MLGGHNCVVCLYPEAEEQVSMGTMPSGAGDGGLAQAAQRGCGVSSLEAFKSRLEMGLGSLRWVALLEQALGLVASNILWFSDLHSCTTAQACARTQRPTQKDTGLSCIVWMKNNSNNISG